MSSSSSRRPDARAVLIWGTLALAVGVPLAVAATSPLLQWRGAAYVAGGLAGVVGLALLLVQPLLARGALPGLGGRRGRRAHALVGAGLVLAVALHVGLLWVTSPPDVIDVLLLRSPTPFAVWGVAAMWAVLGAALLALWRRRLRFRTWRRAHLALAAVTVGGTATHALLIEGTMGPVSKAVLCASVVAAALWAAWPRGPARRSALASRAGGR